MCALLYILILEIELLQTQIMASESEERVKPVLNMNDVTM